MKSKKELNAVKNEVEAVSESPRELTDEELAQVTGGARVVGLAVAEIALAKGAEVAVKLEAAEGTTIGAKIALKSVMQ